MVGWHYQLNGHEFEEDPGVGDEQESLKCCSPWDCKESDTTKQLNSNSYMWASVMVHMVKKKSACNAGHTGSVSGSGRSPGEGNGYSIQYSCLENSMDRRAWWAKWCMGLQKVRYD